MRILLTGVTGQLGQELLPRLRELGEVFGATRAECDLGCDPGSVPAIRSLVAVVDPTVIVNAAAYTAVDAAEQQQELAYAINCKAPGVLAEEARKRGAMLVHYSTDYVFDGSKAEAYTEQDRPAPLNVYGASKLAGENAVCAAGGRSLVLRTSWVYGTNGKNFLLTIRRLAREQEELKIVDDQTGAPTSAAQIARATTELVRRYAGAEAEMFPAGVYHMTAGGSVSWCGFARAIVAALRANQGANQGANEAMKLERIVPISSVEYPTPARRPLNSRLNNSKFEGAFGFRLESWGQGLAEVVGEIRRREAQG
jgi:dTDP-4-dehydrorhamnose reductase